MARLLTISTVLFALIGCTRDVGDRSVIRLKVNKSEKAQASAGTSCFAVNVTGPGIANSGGACSPPLGDHAGFVQENDVLEVSVRSGGDRRVELYMFDVPTGQACPTWDQSFKAAGRKNYGTTFRVAELTGVDLQGGEQTLTMDVNFPGNENHLSKEFTGCTAGQVNAMLYSDGQVVTVTGAKLSPDVSKEINLSFGKSSEGSSSLQSVISTASGALDVDGAPRNMPPFIHSVFKVPDDPATLYGTYIDGTIVKIDPNSGTITNFTAANCPLIHCKAPNWFESLSGGFGGEVFVKAFGGQLFSLNADGSVETLVEKVPPYVTQVVFF